MGEHRIAPSTQEAEKLMSPQTPLLDLPADLQFVPSAIPDTATRIRKPGRPSKFTPDVTGHIIASLRAGNYVETAVGAAGISKALYYQWMNAGREALVKDEEGIDLTEMEEQHLDFFMGVVQAQYQAEERAVTHWAAAFATDWRACERWLARRHSGRWKEVTGTEITTGEGLGVPGASVDDDGIAALARQLEIRALGKAGKEIVDAEVVDNED